MKCLQVWPKLIGCLHSFGWGGSFHMRWLTWFLHYYGQSLGTQPSISEEVECCKGVVLVYVTFMTLLIEGRSGG
ncbi:unnamed protein product [Thelazia callipaeda]|uniref:Secreted protein n=1 Tax=Thelazia callipaeda TaxID=103827 RepID=A0A0N5CJW1_THECL|nr:unnamed protein product [Thelazia callipaeda]